MKKRRGQTGLHRARDPNTPVEALLRLFAKHPDAVAENPVLPLLSLESEEGVTLLLRAQAVPLEREIVALVPNTGQRAYFALLAQAGARLLAARPGPHPDPLVESSCRALVDAKQGAAATGNFSLYREARLAFRQTLLAYVRGRAHTATTHQERQYELALESAGQDALFLHAEALAGSRAHSLYLDELSWALAQLRASQPRATHERAARDHGATRRPPSTKKAR